MEFVKAEYTKCRKHRRLSCHAFPKIRDVPHLRVQSTKLKSGAEEVKVNMDCQ